MLENRLHGAEKHQQTPLPTHSIRRGHASASVQRAFMSKQDEKPIILIRFGIFYLLQ